jgi:hypothetical protein
MPRTALTTPRSKLGDRYLQGLAKPLFHLRASDLDSTVADGAQITSWVDAYTGYTWTGTGAAKPVLVKNYTNGKSCVRSSGSTYFTMASADSTKLQDSMQIGKSMGFTTSIFVAKLTVGANSADLPLWSKRNLNAGANGGCACGFYGGSAANAWLGFRTENADGSSTSDFRGSTLLLNTLVIGTVNFAAINLNGVAESRLTVSNTGAGEFARNTNPFLLFAMQGGGSISYTTADLCELIVYADQPPISVYRKAIGYLGEEYGITITP